MKNYISNNHDLFIDRYSFVLIATW